MDNSSEECKVDCLMKLYYLPVSYSLIFIVGLVGNVTSISIYLTKLRPWKSSSIIMINLAVTDLLYVLTLPFLVYYYSNKDSWRLGDVMCRFVRFGFHFHLYGSILFLTCAAVFRFVVVIQPLRAAQIQKRLWGIIACSTVWIIAAVEVAPMLSIISIHNTTNKMYCLDFANTIAVNDVRTYGWLLTAFGFALPLVVVFICYVGIVKQLAKGLNSSSRCRMRARRVTVLILVVFVMCFLPYHILRVLWIETQSATGKQQNIVQAAYIISRPLAGINTFFNLALYTLSGNKFRRALLDTFNWGRRLKKTRSVLQLAVIAKAGSDMPAA
ncbi:2-oxoglutarate receptor 1-like [Cololabis saira]|uniref:2-oxoglutarate receptor 1-like n=1 Tax=Cololabis saira TaxID=129043 RepID=UPI002AD34D2D|nr:2-oxoglutarate receptor 1-like [Cololabis saira]